ncbi:MAG TPA: protein kinase, partial [Thermoanaerobaculia bacterium]|nr:protein kinase [Thermoanaerobaculia bacterium]
MEEIPRQIGPYRILQPLGAGGMGEVLLAHDERLDRKVAIKRIRRDATSPDQRERFRREARLAARLNHSAIVQVHDLVTEGDVDNLVMEYVEGSNLRALSRRGPLPVCEVLDLGIQIAQGLREAHRHGIVHRDLKTENVLVTSEGQAKIADFGIAKRLADAWNEESLTRTDAILGTYRTMSPEQARGGPVDHCSDLFAFGVLLYELLTGQSPFQGENPLATLDRIVHHRQTPAREINPAVPEGLSRVVDRLLEKEPALRPRSAGEVVRDLEEIAGGRVEESGTATLVEVPATIPVPVTEEAAEAVRRGPWRVLAAGLLAASLVLAGFLALRPPATPLHVGVLRPEIGLGTGRGEVELLATGLRVALLQALVDLEGISPKSFEEVDEAAGLPAAVARAVSAQELWSSRLDCRLETCRIVLSRLDERGTVLRSESFELPADDVPLLSRAVLQQVRTAYPDHPARGGRPGRAGGGAELRQLLLLRTKMDSGPGAPYEEILSELESLHRKAPADLDVCLLGARAARQRFGRSRAQADLELAQEWVRRSLRIAPNAPEPLLLRIDVALAGQDLEVAEQTLERLEEILPGDVRLLDRRALLLDARGKPEEGMALLRKAARLNSSARRLATLAQIEIQQGENEEARRHLEQLLARAPGNAKGLSLLATLELLHGNLRRAAGLYQAMPSPGPNQLSNLGLAYLLLGEHGRAEKVFRKTVEMEPGNPLFVLNLADARLLRGDVSEARDLYERVIELAAGDPAAPSPSLLTLKAQALAHLGRGPEAVIA